MKQKVGIVGNRQGWTCEQVKENLERLEVEEDALIISGGAIGVDSYAQEYAKKKGCSILIHYPKPNTPISQRYFDRNKKIAEDCDFLIAFDRDNQHSGTKNTIRQTKSLDKSIIIIDK